MAMGILRYGLLVTLMVWGASQATWAQEPAPIKAIPAADTEIKLTYQGIPFEEWLQKFRTELHPAQRLEALSALSIFGRSDKAEIVVPLILELMDGYNVRASLMLVDEFNEGVEELQKPLREGRLPEGFQTLGFNDADDLRLYLTANRNLRRLTPRVIPLLVKHLESEGKLSASRIAVMRTLSMDAPEEWLRLVPQLVARDRQTATITMHIFSKLSDENEFFGDDDAAEECLTKLLDVKSSRNHVLIVHGLTTEQLAGQRKTIRLLLEDLQKKSTDEKVQQAIKQALTHIAPRSKEESNVVPASVKEEAKP